MSQVLKQPKGSSVNLPRRSSRSTVASASTMRLGLQCIMLTAFVGWLVFDPYSEPMMTIATRGVTSFQMIESADVLIALSGLTRFSVFASALVVFGAINVWMLLKVFRQRRYSLGQLMLVTGLVAIWCGVLVGWRPITWKGKQLRAANRINAIDQLASRLDKDWPTYDGEIAGLGPFNAYPTGRPTVLLLLTPYPLPGTNTVIAAVERSPAGILRFQLGGEDGGDWIEWHEGTTVPGSFTGGLQDRHELKRFSRLKSDWYLVRYREAGSQSS